MIFSISDLDAEQEVPEAFAEEAADAGSGGLGDEAAAGPSEQNFPVETSITITKPSGGALTIDAIAQGASCPRAWSCRAPFSRVSRLTRNWRAQTASSRSATLRTTRMRTSRSA